MPDAPRYPIESVGRALRLLSMFKDAESLSLSTVAAELDVTRSTAHRLMAMFVWHRYADQLPQSKEYVVGPSLMELSVGVVRGLNIIDRARPLLQRIAVSTTETVHLVVLNGAHVTFIDGIESNRVLRAGSRVGARVPAHAAASGKALLAALPEEHLTGLFPDTGLRPLTAHTVSTLPDLRAQLKVARERRYAVSDQESEPGMVAIAAVLPGRTTSMNLALSVALPSVRADDATVARIGELLRAVVDDADG